MKMNADWDGLASFLPGDWRQLAQARGLEGGAQG